TVILNAANTYSGTTTVKNGGVLSTSLLANGGTASNLGQSSNAATNLVVDGGTLQYTGPAASTDRLFTLSQNGGTLGASGNGAVNTTGTLGGTGIIAPGSGNAVTVASGGTVFPGTATAPTGALKVNGAVTLQSGGQFAAALGSNASQTSNSLDLSSGGSVN